MDSMCVILVEHKYIEIPPVGFDRTFVGPVKIVM